MGNCLSHCLGKLKARNFLRTKYYDKDYSVEFETLIDEETAAELPQSISSRLTFRGWKQLAQDEDELRLEEEAFIEASQEAVWVAKLAHSKEIINPAKLILNQTQKLWPSNNGEDWNIVRATSDFDIFLENADSKSQATKQDGVQGQNSITETVSTTSSNQKERTFSNTNSTPPSEVELEWDNESGIVPGLTSKPRSKTEEDLASLVKQQRTTQSSPSSNELEWDNDFVRAEAETSPDQEMNSIDMETEHLISEIEKLTTLAIAEEVTQEGR